jgi:hypothetical protein
VGLSQKQQCELLEELLNLISNGVQKSICCIHQGEYRKTQFFGCDCLKRLAQGCLRDNRSAETLAPVIEEPTLIFICNKEDVIKNFQAILAAGQQHMCKKIAKWWIKAINPNKQTNYPYKRGSAGAPWWWPKRPLALLSGEIPKGFVRHTEPDHLSKAGKKLFQYCNIWLTDLREIRSSFPHTKSSHRPTTHTKTEFHYCYKASGVDE